MKNFTLTFITILVISLSACFKEKEYCWNFTTREISIIGGHNIPDVISTISKCGLTDTEAEAFRKSLEKEIKLVGGGRIITFATKEKQ